MTFSFAVFMLLFFVLPIIIIVLRAHLNSHHFSQWLVNRDGKFLWTDTPNSRDEPLTCLISTIRDTPDQISKMKSQLEQQYQPTTDGESK